MIIDKRQIDIPQRTHLHLSLNDLLKFLNDPELTFKVINSQRCQPATHEGHKVGTNMIYTVSVREQEESFFNSVI